MKAVIQRVQSAAVAVAGQTVGSIDHGLLVLLGIADTDTPQQCDLLVKKILNCRIFEDETGKMSSSVQDVGGHILCVSQFTLYADTSKGRRPNFTKAAKPEQAKRLYETCIDTFETMYKPIQTGQFGAMMSVSLVNDGPVTLIIEV